MVNQFFSLTRRKNAIVYVISDVTQFTYHLRDTGAYSSFALSSTLFSHLDVNFILRDAQEIDLQKFIFIDDKHMLRFL